MGVSRKIVRIDEEKCNGCGQCVPGCAEGAIQVIDGKARLVSEVYCDGLGACLGECPLEAITIEEREAENFDERAVALHLAGSRPAADRKDEPEEPVAEESFRGCPGTLTRMFEPPEPAENTGEKGPSRTPSKLANWPVQLKLAPLSAPYYQGAKLLVSADCVSFAYGNFQGDFLAGRTLLIGCPKLDDTRLYHDKLTEIFRNNAIESVEVAVMEVPCCNGLAALVEQAVQASGKSLSVKTSRIGIRGELLESRVSTVSI